MTDKTASDAEPTDLKSALIELRHAREEITRLRPFVDMVDQAQRAADAAVLPAASDRCPHGCDVSTCPCLACEADQTALRDRIAAAIWERQNPGRRWADCEYRWRADAEADADAVLAVLPAPADRPAILREAADVAARFNSDCQNCAVELEVATKLRRMADEATAGEAQQPETQAFVCKCPAEICHCGHHAAVSQPGKEATQ
jgi:hypothetical protein